MVLTFVSPIAIVSLTNIGDDDSFYETLEDLGEEEEDTEAECDSEETFIFNENMRFFSASEQDLEALNSRSPEVTITIFMDNVELEVKTPPPRRA